MNSWMPIAIAWALSAVTMAVGWCWQRRHQNIGIVDVLWAAALGSSAILLAAFGDGAMWPRTLLALLGGTWGMRLAGHLWYRVNTEREDGRYRNLRAHWQGHQGKFFLFFQFQALLVAVFALPFLAVTRNPVATTPWLIAGGAIWIVSVLGESIADRQLARFRAQAGHRSRTCRAGLWRYSRHPNYFFEWAHWFAYVALAAGSPIAWLSWLGPIGMFVFLRWISGVPYTELQALRTRGDDYRDYQQRTPMFFPWFPKTAASTATHQRSDR
jgi:steroid 5-alpha reductase family enzyme